MKLDLALEVIKHYEGLRLEPYLCSADVPTIGYGTITYPDGQKVSLSDDKITKRQAESYLAFYVSNTYKQITSFLKNKNISMREHEICALASFCYNLGMGPLLSPTRSLHRAVVSKDNASIAQAMSLYVCAGGERLKGLERRRHTEITLFLTGEIVLK